jgi:DEAD/DEAH box helicase
VPGLIIGGENIQKEKSRLRKGINILIGTPSKVAYHLRSSMKNCSLLNLKWLVVEECDLSFGLGQGKFLCEVLDIIKDYEINMGKGVKRGFGSFKNRAKKGDLKKLAEKQAILTEVGTANSGIETQLLAKELDAEGNEIEPESLKDMEKRIRNSIKGGYEYKGYDLESGTFGGLDQKKQAKKDWRQEREEAME